MGIKNFLCFFFLYIFTAAQRPVLGDRKSYVVYLGRHSHGSAEPSALDLERVKDYHHELLGSYIGSKEKAKELIFTSYKRYINGFAAMLEEEEAAELSKHPKVVSVFPSRVRKLHTTNSWEFLGVERNGETTVDSIWEKANFGEDIIIGVMDSGVWPESASFNDARMGPVPSKWKGSCDSNDGVKCNRKLIGARYFNKGFKAEYKQKHGHHPVDPSLDSARDHNGHGTHTMSTAGGGFVPGANLLGSANGTAKGGAPLARVASYKVCSTECTDPDILDGIEAAIHDGVDIISISLGPSFEEGQEFSVPEYFKDATAIGAFHATEQGILVVASAGNEGPRTVQNVAPWILTVAASSIDRDFPSDVILGNNKLFKGLSFNSNTSPPGKYYPLVNSVDAKAANASYTDAELCVDGSLDPAKVTGKIVYCTRDSPVELQKSFAVSKAGGVGMILANQLESWTLSPQAHFVPTAHVTAADGLSILAYIYRTKSPVAYIRGTTELGQVAAPIMASFSSSGPNYLTPEILKPDITAPGVNILAAYTQAPGPADEFPQDPRRNLAFNIVSGTSMSCPHVSGIGALLRKLHPDWSPAAIKSAIMTTARTKSNVRRPILSSSLVEAEPFDYGSGHVWPNRAMNPGLVYDLTTKDHINFLCLIGYNSTQLYMVAKQGYKCPSGPETLLDYNYPSITVPHLLGNVTLYRTLKNVGTPGLYTVRVKAPRGISVKVEPTSLQFSKLHEEKTYKVELKVEGNKTTSWEYLFGGITWSDGKHHVRSPVVVRWTEEDKSHEGLD